MPPLHFNNATCPQRRMMRSAKQARTSSHELPLPLFSNQLFKPHGKPDDVGPASASPAILRNGTAVRVSPVLPHSSPPLFIARCADAAGLPFQPGRYFSNGCGHTSAASNHFLEVSHFSSSNDDCRIVGITKVDATYRTKMACAFTSGGGMKMIRDITPISSTSFRFSDNEEGIAFSQTYRHCGGGETIDATNARHFWGVFVS